MAGPLGSIVSTVSSLAAALGHGRKQRCIGRISNVIQ
jgi:hypothetical protein